MAYTLLAFILYLAGMLGIGWYFYFRTRNLSDFILGGRRLNTWVTSLSAQASDMSGWLLMGLPGYAYIYGTEAFWIAIGLAVGTYLNWKIVAVRLRRYTELAQNSLTLPDYFENRFKDTSRVLRFLSSLFILVFFLIYTASGFVAGAKLFTTVFDWPYEWALLIGVLVIITYTFLGGFMAVSWTDFFQGTIMFCAILIVPILGVYQAGGIGVTVSYLQNLDPSYLDMFIQKNGSVISVITMVSLLAWGLGYFGQPHILVRFMAIKSPRKIGRARMIAMVWVVICLACAACIGIIGYAVLREPFTKEEAEKVFMLLVTRTTHPFIAGALLAAVLAAIMSTADSQLLVTSSALTEDFYRVLLRRNAGERELVWFGRFGVIAVAAVASVIAFNPENTVLTLVAYAWAGFGATFGPVILLSLYWKRMNRFGAIAGIAAGGCTVLVWKQLSGDIHPVFELYEIVPGFILSVCAIIIVSLVTSPPSAEIQAEFEQI